MMIEIARNSESAEFYRRAMKILLDAKVPFLLGGGHALLAHTGIARTTKDLDMFLLPADVNRALHFLSKGGFRTELAFSHWLAKAHWHRDFVDLIFNAGNGCCPVDARWFEHALDVEVLGLPIKVCPAEESIWQKAFIMERERYDGADVAHLLKACATTMDWSRLLERFGRNWRLLFAHLVQFGFIFPGEKELIPGWVMQYMMRLLIEESDHQQGAAPVCYGTVLSREQYLVDVTERGYWDARLLPIGTLTAEQISDWTPPQPT
jgi:hypothetical protein